MGRTWSKAAEPIRDGSPTYDRISTTDIVSKPLFRRWTGLREVAGASVPALDAEILDRRLPQGALFDQEGAEIRRRGVAGGRSHLLESRDHLRERQNALHLGVQLVDDR